jgi:glycosyltransferase involved in cell wall biosynthesis
MTASPGSPRPLDLEPEAAPERRLTVIVPVYGNAATLPRLCEQVAEIELPAGVRCEVVFVVDGSPDRSVEVLESCLATWSLPSRLVVLSRNFGSFAAIRAGLELAEGDYFAVISADLQEPPALIPQFVERLCVGDVDLVLGRREGRADPLGSRVSAGLFWRLYRRWVQPSMPLGGVDVFACNAAVRSSILELEEANSSLVGQLLWIGFRRATVGYERLPRTEGKSAWTLAKKFRYLSDSVFSFTDLPIRFLLLVGMLGSLIVSLAAVIVAATWWLNGTDVPGYTPLMLAVLLVGFVVILALGIVGSYVWRTYENTKRRPLTIVQSVRDFPGRRHG